MPAVIVQEKDRPALPAGVQSGDLSGGRAIVWARCDRPARMWVDYATTGSFRDAQSVPGPAALEATDLTARVDLGELPAGQRIFYRVRFQDLADIRVFSEPVTGQFRTPPAR